MFFCPVEPQLIINLDPQDRYPVDQCCRHTFDQSVIFRPIPCGNDPSSFRKLIFSDPPFQKQRIKCLLNIGSTGGQLIQKQTELFILFRQKYPGRTKDGAFADNSWNSADIFRSDLRTKQRFTFQTVFSGDLLHQI